jgi:alkyl hydroperoxide reductase subunit AhpC
MIRIGQTVPRFRVTAFVNGTLDFIDSTRFTHHWMVLCFVPRLGLNEASFVDPQANYRYFSRHGCLLIPVG